MLYVRCNSFLFLFYHISALTVIKSHRLRDTYGSKFKVPGSKFKVVGRADGIPQRSRSTSLVFRKSPAARKDQVSMIILYSNKEANRLFKLIACWVVSFFVSLPSLTKYSSLYATGSLSDNSSRTRISLP